MPAEGPTVKTLEQLLSLMVQRGASDMLLTAGAPAQLRIHGAFHGMDMAPFDRAQLESFAAGLLGEEGMAHLQRDKNVDMSRGFEGLCRFRFNVYYQRDSATIAVRAIPFEIPKFETLGLPSIVRDFALRPHGLVLITGPAGSGKSTTLAAMIDYINTHRRVHVVCIEDPIEYLHHHGTSVIDQREIGADVHTFADALRSVFRQSPDVIMVGEMRDLETMQLALSLAETGHLILATLHTQDATHAINRVVDIFPAGQQQQIYTQLSLVLMGVVSQQLLPTLDGKRRVMACEVMNVNLAIRNLIREMQIQQIYSVIQTGRVESMVTMNDSLKALVDERLIDRELAMSRSPRPKELMRMLGVARHSERGSE